MRRGLPVPALGIRGLTVVAGLLASSAVSYPVSAQSTSTDRVLAEALFREGRDLMGQNKVSEACAKFGESYRLDPALGTLINLALCHEKDGRTASAWAEFNDAAAEAAAEKDDREAFARKHIATLTPELSHLKLLVDPKASVLPSLEIKVDGRPLGKAAWSSPLPLDPGPHDVSGAAEGKKAYSLSFTIPKGPATTNIAVPALEDAPKPEVAPVAGPPEQSPRGGSTQRTVGYVVGGVGVVGLLVGATFGLSALSLKGDRDDRCVSGNLCDPAGVAKDRHARDAAVVSTVGFIAGGAVLAGGVVLVLTAPKAIPLRVGIGLGERLVVEGTF